MLFSVEQAFVGREEIRAPLKTPAWEANKTLVGSKCSYNPVILAFQDYFTSYKVLIFFFFFQTQTYHD